MTTKINIKGSGKQRCQEQVPCDCIITAAGLSSRMGTWKMMLPYCQGTMLDASLKNALAFCQRVILVVGHRGEELEARYLERPRLSAGAGQLHPLRPGGQ